jgi:Phage Tail Collar Domain
MTAIFAFIATETTYANYVPNRTRDQDQFNRRVSRAFKGNQGGFTRAGQLLFTPLATAQPGYLLCNGAEVAQSEFPELYAYLGDSQGVAAVGMFKLPTTAAMTFSDSPPIQVVEGGTVSTGADVATPNQPAQIGGTVGGNVLSGARTRRQLD